MDIGQAFTFLFKDDEWFSKILVGWLVVLACFTIIGIPVLLGYMLAIIRNVENGAESPLPAWGDLGSFFKEGLILALVFIVWAVPIWLLALLQAIFGMLLGGGYDTSAQALGFIGVCLSCLTGLWAIVMALFGPAIFIRFARAPEFKSGFDFSELWAFTQDNLGNVIIAIVLSWVAYLLSSVGVILCGVGVFATMFWAATVQSHLCGQISANQKGHLVKQAPVE